MFPFEAKTPFSTDQMIAACKMLLIIARTDGVHPSEETLIRSFYESGDEQNNMPSYTQIAKDAQGEFHLDIKMFSDNEQKELLMGLCVMTAYADGEFSAGEKQVISAVAKDLGIPEPRLNEMIEAVKDGLLAQLSHLPDAGSVSKVVKELD